MNGWMSEWMDEWMNEWSKNIKHYTVFYSTKTKLCMLQISNKTVKVS